MASKTTLKVAIVLGSALFLSGCDDAKLPEFLKKNDKGSASATAGKSGRTKSGEQDVEAPEIFQLAEKGLWDGRPSLGGVWVAHPDAKDPERVIIRNQANGKSVVGALFRREREVPGPRFQVSSDAAEALGMLAGAPAELSVTALRKEIIKEAPAAPDEELDAPEKIEQSSLDDPIAAASAALAKTEAASAKSAPPPKPTAPKAAAASALSKPYIQVGIFSFEANAKQSAAELQKAGLTATIKPGSTGGKSFWRVLVGPAGTEAERAAALKKSNAMGFTDAYPVSN
ncbi:SPOR domain-containing protein [Aliiroseovarius sp. F47248L]|uniref:SPOR domain-containing protein n=1 Tax=Aliiroseovarius sp. F47248L TaxID=2926420 RepID=UPI001FF4B2C1|nr:SPOR domain-containing protein [Aliiroseovarius sp. F47248L]MCK0139276.1 SPOR domain-containing protein [Aliiroseovarius sp. F47248L]